jgi:putative pyruvate formate lyase activating enzyme
LGAQKQTNEYQPRYLKLCESGELSHRIEALWKKLESCDICPHQCRVNRLQDQKGICRTGSQTKVSSFGPHFGEESPLVGKHGSGTIFFANCNLGCVFCQNYDISHLGEGYLLEEEKIGEMMLSLQEMGCHNINFVTPTHAIPQIVKALAFAIKGGLNIPLVYNTGGYDAVSTLRLLEGVFDIYMPDLKYSDDRTAQEYCNADDYYEIARQAIKEMHRQVGDLVMDDRGIAQKGLLIRHLILPEDLAGTYQAMKFVAEEISPNTYVNLMDQYRPCFRANDYPPLNRRISHDEYAKALQVAKDFGIGRLD